MDKDKGTRDNKASILEICVTEAVGNVQSSVAHVLIR